MIIVGHRSSHDSSSRSHSSRDYATSSGSYRTVIDKDKEKKSDRSHGDRGNRKSRTSKKEKDKRRERKRFFSTFLYFFFNCMSIIDLVQEVQIHLLKMILELKKKHSFMVHMLIILKNIQQRVIV